VVKTYKDYPKLHWFLAGDVRANSLPVDPRSAHKYIANSEVQPEWETTFGAAEAYLATTGLTNAQLFDAGFETNGGMCVDDEDTCIGDLPSEKIMDAWAKLYAKYGIHDLIVHDAINLTY